MIDMKSRKIGAWTVQVFECGRLALDGGAMFGSVPRVVWERRIAPDAAHRIPLAMRLVLARRDDVVVLVDAGIGDKFDARFAEMFSIRNPATSGGVPPLVACLQVLGVAPEQVTHVLLTHLHFDHAGGATRSDLTGESVPVFPNAEHFLQRANWATAQYPNARERASYLPENVLPLARVPLTLVDGSAQLLDGLRVERSDGHTAGMQVLRLEGGAESLLYLADLSPTQHHLHVPFTMGYDLCAAQVMREKQSLLERAVHERSWVIFEHDPQVVGGRVVLDRGKFTLGEAW